MQLGSATLAPKSFTRHLVARAHKKGARKKMMIATLALTSMVDMFSLLVIFLLQAFSASPELLTTAKGVTLPSASTGLEIKDAPVLALARDEVFLDQKVIGSVDSLLADPAPLMEGLEKLRTLWQTTHPQQKFPGEIILQAHKDLPAPVVSQFMSMLPSQAFGSIQLAVMGGGSK